MAAIRRKRHVLKDSLTPRELSAELARIERLRHELESQQRTIKSHARRLATGLASVMRDGDCHYRIGLALWAFEVGGEMCLALIDSDDDPTWLDRGVEPRYRLAVLTGGLPAVRHLSKAPLPATLPSESDPRRKVVFASYGDYSGFLARLPRYVHDIARDLESELEAMGETQAMLEDGRLKVELLRELQPMRRPPRPPPVDSPKPKPRTRRRTPRPEPTFKPWGLPPIVDR